MISKLIAWAIHNLFVAILLTLAVAGVGGYAFLHINVEAYPDPAPAIVEVIAQYPGASAEEVERQVTIPLEVALAGMPGLKYTRSKSLFGLSHIRNQFEYGIDFNTAKIEVLNRMHGVELPAGVKPELAPTSPTGEIYRYTLKNPRDRLGQEVYNLTDLKTVQDWTLEKEFRRVPRIADVISFGGAVKRYEIQPDPNRLKQYGISLEQLEKSIADSNGNVGGDYLVQGDTVQAVRGLGLLGHGRDPALSLLGVKEPREARDILRVEEQQRLQEMREIVLASTNNVPVRVGDVVDGGPRPTDSSSEPRGVVVGKHTRMGTVSVSRPRYDLEGNEVLDGNGERVWDDVPETVQGIVLLRKGEKSLPALADVKAKVRELNSNTGKLLPGVKLEPFYDRTTLVDLTTETVHENLILGLSLVTFILLLFLNHFQSALIVAVNIPLALMFAFAVLYLRGKSANLLSLGAVDFGIIVDSSVIMVESIYRYLGSGTHAELPLATRIQRATGEVERSLFYSTIIMVVALLPLFTMEGPEGQIFGPMADTYAFALGGALLLSLTLSPVLCMLFFKKVKPAKDNFLVRGLKRAYLWQARLALDHRAWALGIVAAMIVATGLALPHLGCEFMPELEEGNIYVRSTFPVQVSREEVVAQAKTARAMLRKYPEVKAVLSQVGRPDDGTDPTGFYNAEFFVPLKVQPSWPKLLPQTGWRGVLFGKTRSRTKEELIEKMDRELERSIPGIDWNFSQNIRDNVMETLSGVKGENSVKIIGPDLDELESLAQKVQQQLNRVPGIQNVGVFNIKGQANLEFPIDRQKCARWNVSVADVQDVLQTAVGGKMLTEMTEGEKKFDITLRWPQHLRQNVDQILDIPVDVQKNRVTTDATPNGLELSSTGTSLSQPGQTGSTLKPANLTVVPRRRLGDLVTPLNEQGLPDPNGKFVRSGASTISREQGKRLIAVKFSVRGRDLASAVAEAQRNTASLFKAPYTSEWSGEFQEMQEALHRLTIVVILSLLLILVLLYLALQSLLDALVVLSNIVIMSIGGIWALLLTGTNFNISAGVGFVSILGVGIMNGLLMVSRFNQFRAQGIPLREALLKGVDVLIRPLTMTALAAIFGLLPAAMSTRIGSQSQRPLAIAVVGGMLMTLLMSNLIAVLYSFYGNREPRAGAGFGH
jgi:cobalt-zinc-cadmium resistance protein CzcA